MRRWPHLDGLRALAALLVLISHVGFWTGQTAHGFAGGLIARGDSGVAVFFALSAFLLAGPWVVHPGERPDVRTYAVRRAARLLPAYAVALAAVLVAAALGAGDGLGGARRVVAHLFLLQGLTADSYQGFSQTWSLTTEATFYLALPLLGLVSHRGQPLAGPAVRASVAVGLVGVMAHTVLVGLGGWWGVLAASVIGHAAWFAAGLGVLALRTLPLPRRSAWRLVAGAPAGVHLLTAVLAYLVAATSLGGPRDLTAPTLTQVLVKELLYAVLAGSLLLAATTSPGGVTGAVLGSRPAALLGRVSYGVFLWHVLVLQVTYEATGWELFAGRTGAVVGITLVASLALAALSWIVVERPALSWAHRGRRRPRGARA